MLFWLNITRFGDSIILFPAALVIAVWLMVGGLGRLAFYWCVLFGSAMAIVVASKLAFIGWGIGSESLDFTGISGHAARACAVVPVLFYLALQRPPRKAYALTVMIGAAVALLLSISRVVVHAHSVSEVITGVMLGGMVSGIFLLFADKQVLSIRHRWLLLPSMFFVLVTPVAKPAPTQELLTSVALYLSGHSKPFDKTMWRTPLMWSRGNGLN